MTFDYPPARAPRATRLAIHDSSSAFGMNISGESVKILFSGFNLEKADEVHPKVVPSATELKFAIES